MTRAHQTRYSFSMPALMFLALLLTACSSELADPSPNFDINPWVCAVLPFKVYIAPEMDAKDAQGARDAIATINSTAGGTIFLEVSTTDAAIQIVYSDEPGTTAARATSCGPDNATAYIAADKALMYDTRRTGRSEATFTHEFLHLLGYYSETGDIHDAEGSLMSTSIEVLYMAMSPRHALYVQELLATY